MTNTEKINEEKLIDGTVIEIHCDEYNLQYAIEPTGKWESIGTLSNVNDALEGNLDSTEYSNEEVIFRLLLDRQEEFEGGIYLDKVCLTGEHGSYIDYCFTTDKPRFERTYNKMIAEHVEYYYGDMSSIDNMLKKLTNEIHDNSSYIQIDDDLPIADQVYDYLKEAFENGYTIHEDTDIKKDFTNDEESLRNQINLIVSDMDREDFGTL